MNENNIKKKLDALCQKHETATIGVVKEIIDERNSHEVEFSHLSYHFETLYAFLVRNFSNVNYINNKISWPSYRYVQFINFNKNLPTLYVSFDCLMSGFYGESMMLFRPVYEAFIKNVYITCNPIDPGAVIAGKKGKMNSRFNLTNFIEQELCLDWSKYFLSSTFSHSNQYYVGKEIEKINNNPHSGSFPFVEKTWDPLIPLHFIRFMLLVYLKSFVTLFATETNEKITLEDINDAKEFIRLIEADFNTIKNPKGLEYWPTVIKDVQDIFGLMTEVESGGEWRAVWKEIRNTSD